MSSAGVRADTRAAAAQDTLDILYDISVLLQTGLTRDQLRACSDVLDAGVGAEAVAVSWLGSGTAVRELRKQGGPTPNAHKKRLRD
ncbi:hypothetical protein IE81DRAFT_323891 [Ceraceosorus guamensis]|uniref:Uncharacterized protein n=1 Tax=Ceraceosorus guamensis TaxID=1522189 RepID=A0A316W327_9BASI|nr:hypothetical protein IE81DRAFT_323891 [Ceraceosorus guamensis]PWN42065.1 hypothetical protein IE81DRAFT_323891 [Ceraceosorus guamensis]